MRKAALIVMAVAVAVMFAVPAFAGESTQCSSCAKPCATPCAKPCATPCAKPCVALPKVCVDWKWPTMSVNCPAPCPTPCAKACPTYKRDVLGQKVPTQTYEAGNAYSDKATNYEQTLISGQ